MKKTSKKTQASKESKKEKDLKKALTIIRKLRKQGVEVDERTPNKKWMIESAPEFFGCEGSSLVDVDDLLEIGEMYEHSLNG